MVGLGFVERQVSEVVGADIVEYNPLRDVVDMTAAVGAKLTKELLSALLR